jgi:thymidylate synthase (FAD)
MECVKPKVFLIGYTEVDMDALREYLEYADVAEFLPVFEAAVAGGVHPGEALCSMYAKMCYKALTEKHNDNISRVRDVEANIGSCFDTGHGSVFEHCNLNFVCTDLSRVATHEWVRHRVGVAYSQTSGRYVRSDNLKMVLEDPIVDKIPVKDGWDKNVLRQMKAWAQQIEDTYNRVVSSIDWDAMDFALKKKITSYLRRCLPNGQANEIGVTLNIRSLRHLVQMRTSRFAEWEIRSIFGQVYALVKEKFPLLFHGAKVEMVDGLAEVSGMRMQPYESLNMFSNDELQAEIAKRGLNQSQLLADHPDG